MAVMTLEQENITESPQVLLSWTNLCRRGWEDFLARRHNGLTVQMRAQLLQELDYMKNVVRCLIPEESVRVEDRAIACEPTFKRLVEQWEQGRPQGADVLEMVMHTSYQRIIGMGPDVVPLLLRELEYKPTHWFWALHAITGADPVPPESQGNSKAMAEAWIDWGRKQGYRW